MNNANENIVIVNNTNAILDPYLREPIIAAIKSGGELPEAIADIFTLKIVNVGDQVRGVLDWA